MNRCIILPGSISIYLDDNNKIVSAYRDIPLYAGQEDDRNSWDDDFNPFEIIGYETIALSDTEIAALLEFAHSINTTTEQ